jgi:hypothetical protein
MSKGTKKKAVSRLINIDATDDTLSAVHTDRRPTVHPLCPLTREGEKSVRFNHVLTAKYAGAVGLTRAELKAIENKDKKGLAGVTKTQRTKELLIGHLNAEHAEDAVHVKAFKEFEKAQQTLHKAGHLGDGPGSGDALRKENGLDLRFPVEEVRI